MELFELMMNWKLNLFIFICSVCFWLYQKHRGLKVQRNIFWTITALFGALLLFVGIAWNILSITLEASVFKYALMKGLEGAFICLWYALEILLTRLLMQFCLLVCKKIKASFEYINRYPMDGLGISILTCILFILCMLPVGMIISFSLKLSDTEKFDLTFLLILGGSILLLFLPLIIYCLVILFIRFSKGESEKDLMMPIGAKIEDGE